jgi:hypothetical protein
MELTEELKCVLIETAKQLKGSARRLFLARTVKALGPGGASRAESDFGWNRKTIRKGMHEVESGITCLDAFSARGRKRAEDHLPNLLADIRAIVDGQSQTDPQFKTNRLYTRLTAPEVRRQLMEKFGYSDEELPTATTIGTKLHEMGYHPMKVAKSKPQKKIPATDAIFEQVNQINEAADADPKVLRLSMDTKAIVKIGDFSRGGKKRVQVKAADHDFKALVKVTPVGILVPQFDELFLACVTSKVTSDCLVDVLELWWHNQRERFKEVHTLVINLDNGPENQSYRSQFMARLVEFAKKYQLTVHLAYYPPYHSKYNPVERCWGILENHWNGDLLESVETVINFAQTMTWKGHTPLVCLLTTIYQTGVRLTKQAMTEVEKQLERLSGLERWFVKIACPPSVSPDT